MKDGIKYIKYIPYGVGIVTGITTLLLLRKPTKGKVLLLIGGTLAGTAIGFAASSFIIHKTVSYPDVKQQNL